jgi:hypothetical protein
MILDNIFEKYGINLKTNNKEYRHPIDILEDMYLKLNIEEYKSLMELIAQTEVKEGFIFDISRGRTYR